MTAVTPAGDPLVPSAARERVRAHEVAAGRELVDRRAHRGRMVDADAALGQDVAQRAGDAAAARPARSERRGDVEHDRIGQAQPRRPARRARDVARERGVALDEQALERVGAGAGAARERPPAGSSSAVALRNTPRPSSTAKTTSSPGARPSA